MTTVKVEGFADLEKALADLTQAAGKGVLRRSLKKAAEPIAKVAADLAPDDPATDGYDLRSSITVGTKLSRDERGRHLRMFRNDRAAVEMFAGAGPLPQAVIMEFGTAPFINGGLYAGTTNPGVSPRPFMRPAWDQEARPTLDRLGRILWDEFEKATERAARKAARQAAKG